jgi:hypothetical protein
VIWAGRKRFTCLHSDATLEVSRRQNSCRNQQSSTREYPCARPQQASICLQALDRTHRVMISRVLTNIVYKRVAWSNSSVNAQSGVVTEIYCTIMMIRENDTRSRDPRCVPDWHHRHLHWGPSACQWANGEHGHAQTPLWHACWPYSCSSCSAQRLNSADTACCCRAPNFCVQARCDHTLAWKLRALPAERSGKKYQLRRSAAHCGASY